MPSGLRSRADLETILRNVGSFLAMEAGLVLNVAAGSLAAREWYVAVAAVLCALLTGAVGLGVRRTFAGAPAPKMKHGMVIAGGGWFATAVFGAVPFLVAAWLVPAEVAADFVPDGATYASSLSIFRDPLHALFESMSGFTGTGLTMTVHEPSLPRGLQWWRSLIEWVGGVGVIVLTVSILARPGSGSYALFRSEAREKKIHPSIIHTVRTTWLIVVGFTAVATVALFVAIRFTDYGGALPLWEAGWQALNHA